MRKITIQLTQDCNFRCKYCGYSQENDRQRHHTKRKIPIETAKKAILFLRDHSVDNTDVAVGFYGGEPLLEFDMLRELTCFAEEVFEGKEDVRFHITTNASLLTDEIVEFFIEHKFNVLVSLDGIEKINDKNRVFPNGQGTYDTVIHRLEHIYKKYPEFYAGLSVNMVIDPSNDFDVINSIFSDSELMKNTHIQSSMLSDLDSDEPAKYVEEYVSKSEYHHFLEYLALLSQYPLSSLSPLMTQDAHNLYREQVRLGSPLALPDVGCPGGPCLPGELRTMVTTDGTLVVCERVSETSDCMKIGDLDRGFQLEKVKSLMNIGSLSPEECKKCWAFRHCQACCRLADQGGSLSGKRKLEFCGGIREGFFHFLRFSILLKEAKSDYTGRRSMVL